MVDAQPTFQAFVDDAVMKSLPLVIENSYDTGRLDALLAVRHVIDNLISRHEAGTPIDGPDPGGDDHV